MADAFIKSGNPGLSGLVNAQNALDSTHLNDGSRVKLPASGAIPGVNAPLTQTNPYIADVTRTDQARTGMVDLNPSRRTALNEAGPTRTRDLGPLPEMYQYGGANAANLPGPYGTGYAQDMLGFSQVMWAAVQTVDPLIEKKLMMVPRFWHDRIPRGQFQLHNGLVHQRRIFRGSIYKTTGLDEWEAIDPIPSLSNDPCRFPKHGSIDYAWDQLAWSGMRAAWGSDPICANAFRYVQDAAQQLSLILEAGMEVGVKMQETFNREFYLAQSVNFGRSFVMSSVTYGQANAPRFFYDPFVKFGNAGNAATKTANRSLVLGKDNKPHPFVVIDASVEIEPLNWYSLDRVHEMLKIRCPDAALGSNNGEPVFGLMANNDDVVKSIEGDDKVYREWLEAKPQQLIDDYKLTFRTYRDWAIVSDPRQLRFKILRYIANWDSTACDNYGGVGAELVGKADKGVYIAIAVEPIVAEANRKGINGGDIPCENIDYVNAELAIAPVFMNNVFTNEFETQGQVNLGNGTHFGAFPALNGQWGWVRGPQTDADPFQQTGKFYGLFLIHPRPETRVYDTMSFIYRRCKESIRARCPIENPRVNPDAAKKGTAAKIAIDADIGTAGLAAGDTLDLTLAAGYGPLYLGEHRYITVGEESVEVVVVDTTSAPLITVAVLSAVTGGASVKVAKDSVLAVEAPAAEAQETPAAGSDAGSGT